MKRILSLLLVAALLAGLTPALAAGKTPFADVEPGSWYEDAVAALCAEGYVNGVSKTQFAPEGSMTRAMVVTILSRMGGGMRKAEGSGFADVPADAWYADAVGWAAANRITRGVDETHFDPEGVVTREMLSTLIWRYAAMRYEYDYHERFYAEEAFTEADPVSDWAQEAMRLSIGSHVIQGRKTETGVLWAAKGTCTRAEAVTMLHRFLQLELTDKLPIVPADADLLADVSLRLFRAAEEPGENIVASPLSMIYALAMLNNGASGETKAQLEALFGIDAEALTDMLSAYAKTLPNAYGGGKIRLANAMWVRAGAPIRQEFIRTNREKLGAEVFQRTFSAAAVRELNSWVSRQTDGMIPSILSDLPPEAWFVLVNALLFKCNWGDRYQGTTPMDFHAADGTVQKADMLRSMEHFYLHDENAEGFLKILQGHYAFAVVLPKEGMTPAEYLATLDGSALRRLLQYELYDEVHTAMPKFKAEFSRDLIPVFQKAGLTVLTGLDGIAEDAFVSGAVHKAVIDVNEEGVSAAAVTAIVGAGSGIPKKEKIATVIADRPYLYMIVDTDTNVPLFIGVNESI
jgi:serpin B